jgi:hypothetical protein
MLPIETKRSYEHALVLARNLCELIYFLASKDLTEAFVYRTYFKLKIDYKYMYSTKVVLHTCRRFETGGP